jgi:thiamine-phosphate pyrophosphorylase
MESRVERAALRLDLYVITDSRLAGERGNLWYIEEAIAGGADAIQLREKDASTLELIELGRALRDLTRRRGVLFIVNDRVDVALAVDADGVHVGQDDMPAPLARRLVGPDRIVGVSATTLAEAEQAARDGADYLGVGPIYPTGTKLDAKPATGVELIGQAKRATGMPVVGIGGIGPANAAEAVAAGADGVAVISAIVGRPDPRAAARAIKESVLRARRRT